MTADAPEPAPDEAHDFLCVDLDVDLGVIALAATSAGESLDHSAGPPRAHPRQPDARSRRPLPREVAARSRGKKTGTTSSKRLLKKRSGRERRFATGVNHFPSQAMGRTARTAHGARRGIALADLEYIRSLADGPSADGECCSTHTWAFGPL